ncbi:hypothetical protein CU097_001019, partial [Rhizopus azygosporus]
CHRDTLLMSSCSFFWRGSPLPQKRGHEEDVDDRNMNHSSSGPIKKLKARSGHAPIDKQSSACKTRKFWYFFVL